MVGKARPFESTLNQKVQTNKKIAHQFRFVEVVDVFFCHTGQVSFWWLLPIATYFVGSLNSARMVGRVVGVDPTKEGSGNPGTTNMFRIAGKKAGIATLVLDAFKTFIPSLIAHYVAGDVGSLSAQSFAVLTGTAGVFGHCLPPLPSAKGGKGVATYLGLGLGAWPLITPLGLSLWGVGKLTKESFVGAILVPPFVVLVLIVFKYPPIQVVCAIATGLLITIRHRPNIEAFIEKRKKRKELKELKEREDESVG